MSPTGRRSARFDAACAALVVLALMLGMHSCEAGAAASLGTFAVNFDGTRSTKWRNGDKPVVPCTPPTGYTEAEVGDGGGEICEQSATEFDFNVSGSNNATDAHIAHKDAGAGDVQIETRITDTFAGSAEPFAAVGIGLRESAAQSSWLFQCHSLQNGSTAVQCKYGTSSGYTTVNGASGQSRPRYVAVTYDLSSGDVRGHASADGSAWTEVASTNRAMSDVLGYMVGASKSVTETTQVTIDNFALGSTIDAYTPSDPPGGGAPTLVTPIENQTGTQGIAFNLSCALNWTGQTPGTHPYTISGLAAGTNLSFDGSICALTGTPDADDVGTRSVTITAKNASGDTPETFQLTISTVPGDVFTLVDVGDSTSSTFNCNSASGANGATWDSLTPSSVSTPGPGDTIILPAATRGPTTFENCTGSDTARITIQNNTAGAGPAVIQKTSSGGIILTCTNCVNVDVDGTGQWSGASGHCGMHPTTRALDDECGIQIRASASGYAQFYVRFNGLSSKFSVKGVELDGSAASGGSIGIGLSMNDGSVLLTNNPGTWREDVLVEGNYIHETGDTTTGECLYLGPDADEDGLPVRRLEIAYNWVHDCGKEGIEVKGLETGPNSIHHNHIERSGTGSNTEPFQNACIMSTDGGDIDVYSNYVENCGSQGIRIVNAQQTTATATDDGPWYANVFNNIIVRPGQNSSGNCVYMQKGAPANIQITPAIVYNNTCVSPTTTAINFGSGLTATRIARNNLIATSGSCTNDSVTGASSNFNNGCGTVASWDFVASGSDNYEVQGTSAACNAGNNLDGLTTDYEDETRPQDSNNELGADEAAACP